MDARFMYCMLQQVQCHVVSASSCCVSGRVTAPPPTHVIAKGAIVASGKPDRMIPPSSTPVNGHRLPTWVAGAGKPTYPPIIIKLYTHAITILHSLPVISYHTITPVPNLLGPFLPILFVT
jgi:hypothetical protein